MAAVREDEEERSVSTKTCRERKIVGADVKLVIVKGQWG